MAIRPNGWGAVRGSGAGCPLDAGRFQVRLDVGGAKEVVLLVLGAWNLLSGKNVLGEGDHMFSVGFGMESHRADQGRAGAL